MHDVLALLHEADPAPDEIRYPADRVTANIGAILRTARAAGVGGVVLPRDRSAGVTPAAVSASAGLVFGLRIARVPNLVRAMETLREAGLWTVGLAPRGGTPLYAFAPPPRLALVAGGEGDGLRSLVRRTCDFTVSLPMASGVESLNVGVAVATGGMGSPGRRRSTCTASRPVRSASSSTRSMAPPTTPVPTLLSTCPYTGAPDALTMVGRISKGTNT